MPPARIPRGRHGRNASYELRYLRDIRGAILGRHEVVITTASEDVPRELLPARYHQETTLTAEVQRGVSAYDFNLTSDIR